MKAVLGVLVVILVVLAGINLTKKDDGSAAINEEASVEETQTSAEVSSPPQNEPQAKEESVANTPESEPESKPEAVAGMEEPDPVPTGKNGFLAGFDPDKKFGITPVTLFLYSFAVLATTPIIPTFAPPYTIFILKDDINLLISSASW